MSLRTELKNWAEPAVSEQSEAVCVFSWNEVALVVRLGRKQAENFAKAVEVVERVLGPLGEVEVLSHLDGADGLYDIDSQKIWVSLQALTTLEEAVGAVLQGAIRRFRNALSSSCARCSRESSWRRKSSWAVA